MGRPPKANLSVELKKLLTTVGRNLRAARESTEISQAELARRSKISTTTLNEIETRASRDIRLSTLLSLSQKLDISLVSLFAESNLSGLQTNDQAQLLKASETILRITRKVARDRPGSDDDH